MKLPRKNKTSSRDKSLEDGRVTVCGRGLALVGAGLVGGEDRDGAEGGAAATTR